MYCVITVAHDRLGKIAEVRAFLVAHMGPVTLTTPLYGVVPFQFGFFH